MRTFVAPDTEWSDGEPPHPEAGDVHLSVDRENDLVVVSYRDESGDEIVETYAINGRQ